MLSARMKNPSLVVPEALPPLLHLGKAIVCRSVPSQTLDLVRLRVSQVNGRGWRLPDDEEPETRRLRQVVDWRNAPCFTDSERAALALAEGATSLTIAADPVPDQVWAEACRYFDDDGMAVLLLHVGLVQLWNCVNVVTRQPESDWRPSQ